MKIEVLGAFGSKLQDFGMTSFLVEGRLAIDAGNIVKKGKKIYGLEHIVLTHQHLDHIADIPYLVSESFPTRRKPLNIYAHQSALDAISRHILNAEIWPDFSSIKMLGSEHSSVRYVSVSVGREFEVDGFKLTAFESNHTVRTFGYRVYNGRENKSFLITGDTWKQDDVWEIANSDPSVIAIFIDVSYPRRMRELARISRHLSSDTLEEELRKLRRKDIAVFIYHMKPAFRKEIAVEMLKIRKKYGFRLKVLSDGEKIEL